MQTGARRAQRGARAGPRQWPRWRRSGRAKRARPRRPRASGRTPPPPRQTPAGPRARAPAAPPPPAGMGKSFTITIAFARRRMVGGCEGTRRVLCLPTLHIAGTFGLCEAALRLTAACAIARPSVAAQFMPRMGLEADSGTRLEQRGLQRAELRAVQRGIHGHQHRGRGRRLQVCARHRLYVLHRLLHQLRAGLRALAAAVRRRLPWCINYYTRFCWKRGEAATASLAAATLCGRGRDHAKRSGACAAARASHAS